MLVGEIKVKRKNKIKEWQSARHREKMLNTSITTAPTMALSIKLMEKMGWQEGQGLGAHHQGITEPITFKQTFAQKGLGFTREKGMEHVHYAGHFERFESVLSSLRPVQSNPNSDSEKETTEIKKKEKSSMKSKKSGGSLKGSSSGSTSESNDSSDSDSGGSSTQVNKLSLESISRGSTRRLHYKKFTRGKDTSRYSANDLACILGSKAHDLYKESVAKKDGSYSMYQQPKLSTNAYTSWQAGGKYEPFNGNNEEEEKDEKKTSNTFVPSYQLHAQHKTSEQCGNNEEDSSRPCFGSGSTDKTDDTDQFRPSFGFSNGLSNAGNEDNSEDETKNNIQKYLQNRFAASYMSAFVKSECIPGTLDANNENTDDDGDKGATIVTNTKENTANDEVSNECEVTKKKKKKRKRKKVEESDPVIEQKCEINENTAKDSKKKNKKRKAALLAEEEEITLKPTEEVESCEPKRKKKKKKHAKLNELTDASIISSQPKTTHISETNNGKAKKKNKPKKRPRDNDQQMNSESVDSSTLNNENQMVDLDDSCCVVDTVENIIFEKEVPAATNEPPKKKKKKSKKSKKV